MGPLRRRSFQRSALPMAKPMTPPRADRPENGFQKMRGLKRIEGWYRMSKKWAPRRVQTVMIRLP